MYITQRKETEKCVLKRHLFPRQHATGHQWKVNTCSRFFWNLEKWKNKTWKIWEEFITGKVVQKAKRKLDLSRSLKILATSTSTWPRMGHLREWKGTKFKFLLFPHCDFFLLGPRHEVLFHELCSSGITHEASVGTKHDIVFSLEAGFLSEPELHVHGFSSILSCIKMPLRFHVYTHWMWPQRKWEMYWGEYPRRWLYFLRGTSF